MFKRPGKYIRLDPEKLLLIEEHKPDVSALTLEDIYVSNPLPEIKYLFRLPLVPRFFANAAVIRVLDDEFPASCFRVRSSSEISWYPKEGCAYIFVDRRIETQSADFQHLPTGDRFVIYINTRRGFRASIGRGAHEDYNWDSVVRKVVGMPLKSGRHVFFSWSHESNDKMAVVMVNVKGKWTPESKQS
jgi:hypothetical protein